MRKLVHKTNEQIKKTKRTSKKNIIQIKLTYMHISTFNNNTRTHAKREGEPLCMCVYVKF